jgi:hypothetical protein
VLQLERLGVEVRQVGDQVVVDLGEQPGFVELLRELARDERDVEALAAALQELADDLLVGGVEWRGRPRCRTPR